MTDQRAKRLFGDDLGQDDPVRCILKGCTAGSKTRGVRGVDVASTGKQLLQSFCVGLDRHGLVAHGVDAEEVGQVQLGGGAGLNADSCAIKLFGRGHAELTGSHKALTVVVVHTYEFELQVNIARECPGGVTRQHVDLTGRKSRKTGLASGRHKGDGFWIPEDGGRNRAANAHIETFPNTVGVGSSKTDEAGRHATVQCAAGFNVVECSSTCHTSGKSSSCQHA